MISPHSFPDAPSLDISFVIVSYNTRDLLIDCLTELTHHSAQFQFEIFVVDNASKDDSVARVRAEFPEVHLIENESNRGLSAADNQALKQARGRYCVLLNSDTRITDNCFLSMLKYMDDHPDFDILAPQIVDVSGQVASMRLWQDTPEDSLQKILGRYDRQEEFRRMQSTPPEEVETVGGPCLMIRRSLFETIGLLDEGFFLYNEEDDLCRRTRNADRKICYFPGVSIQHHVGQSTHQEGIRERVIIETYRSNLYFFSKYYSRRWNWILRTVYNCTFLGGMVKSFWNLLRGRPPQSADDSILLKLRLLFLRPPAP